MIGGFGNEDMIFEFKNILAQKIFEADRLFMGKDVKGLLVSIDSIFCLIHAHMTEEEEEEFEKEVSAIEDLLYGEQTIDDYELSNIFLRERVLYKKLTSILDDIMGLINMKVDPNTIIGNK